MESMKPYYSEETKFRATPKIFQMELSDAIREALKKGIITDEEAWLVSTIQASDNAEITDRILSILIKLGLVEIVEE